MSNQVVPDGRLPPKRIQHEVALHAERMRVIAEVGQAALDEISDVHGYTVYTVAHTLETADRVKKMFADGEGLPSDEEETFGQMRQEYLNDSHRISQVAGAKIVLVADRVQLERRRSLWARFVEWLRSL